MSTCNRIVTEVSITIVVACAIVIAWLVVIKWFMPIAYNILYKDYVIETIEEMVKPGSLIGGGIR